MYQDGLDIPLPQARSEGRKIWPYKAQADFILSVGCGKFRSALNQKKSWFHRSLSSACAALDFHRQYENFRLASDSNNRGFRVDPDLEMDKVRLDNTEAMVAMEECVEDALSSDKDLKMEVRRLSCSMIASLFYFEFTELPHVGSPGPTGAFNLACRGSVTCRYEDDENIMVALGKKYRHELAFSVNGRFFTYQERKDVIFDVTSMSQPFDIKLEYRDLSSSITGFPESASRIISLQESCGSELPVRGPCKRKAAIAGGIVTSDSRKKLYKADSDYTYVGPGSESPTTRPKPSHLKANVAGTWSIHAVPLSR